MFVVDFCVTPLFLQAIGLCTLGSMSPWAALGIGAIASTVTIATNTGGGAGSGTPLWWRVESLLYMVLATYIQVQTGIR